jgi:hypothetical protein
MIDDQLAVFPGHDRFVHILLGLVGVCDAWVEALGYERADGAHCPDGALVEIALGLVSLNRTLRATLAASEEGGEVAAAPSLEGSDARELGGLLR